MIDSCGATMSRRSLEARTTSKPPAPVVTAPPSRPGFVKRSTWTCPGIQAAVATPTARIIPSGPQQ